MLEVLHLLLLLLEHLQVEAAEVGGAEVAAGVAAAAGVRQARLLQQLDQLPCRQIGRKVVLGLACVHSSRNLRDALAARLLYTQSHQQQQLATVRQMAAVIRTNSSSSCSRLIQGCVSAACKKMTSERLCRSQ
jgi:hypothetical protein